MNGVGDGYPAFESSAGQLSLKVAVNVCAHVVYKCVHVDSNGECQLSSSVAVHYIL